MLQRIWTHCVFKCCEQIGGSLLLPGLAVYFTLQDQHSSWIFMIVPPNVRTQRRLFLPDRERRGWEERGDSMPESRSIFSCTAYEGKSALCSARPSLRSTTMDWGRRVAREERQRARRREREREEWARAVREKRRLVYEACTYFPDIHIRRAERIEWPQRLWTGRCHSDAQRSQNESIRAVIPVHLLGDGQDTLGIIVTLFCNWWISFLALFVTRNM